MANAPILPLISVDEYLNSSYEYDREYVDGVLVERSLPTPAHSVLAATVAAYFYNLRWEFKFAVLPRCRL